jgi:long-subunit fatty acid transport protein
VALADDATAAFANPAGLVQLSKPEVSVEGRLWSYSTPFTEGARISGQPTGNLLDDSVGLRTGVASESIAGLSFISFVYPRENWSLAFYRHRSANFKAATETQGFFGDPIDLDDLVLQVSALRVGETLRLPDLRTFNELDIVTYGVAGAYRPSDAVSFGAGVSYFDGAFTNKAEAFALFEQSLPDGIFGENAYVAGARILSSEVTTTDGSDWGLTGGFLWHVSGQWSVGGFYRQGLKFELTEEDVSGPALEPFLAEGTLVESASSPIEFPDVYGLGAAFKSQSGAVTVSFEWDRVQYATIFESLDQEALAAPDLELDDGNEFHFGFEYVFVKSTPTIALRAGVWSDPDHRTRFVGDDEIVRSLLPPGEDQVHFALGFGLAFRKFQIDVGVDLSDLVDTASFSAIYSF